MEVHFDYHPQSAPVEYGDDVWTFSVRSQQHQNFYGANPFIDRSVMAVNPELEDPFNLHNNYLDDDGVPRTPEYVQRVVTIGSESTVLPPRKLSDQFPGKPLLDLPAGAREGDMEARHYAAELALNGAQLLAVFLQRHQLHLTEQRPIFAYQLVRAWINQLPDEELLLAELFAREFHSRGVSVVRDLALFMAYGDLVTSTRILEGELHSLDAEFARFAARFGSSAVGELDMALLGAVSIRLEGLSARPPRRTLLAQGEAWQAAQNLTRELLGAGLAYSDEHLVRLVEGIEDPFNLEHNFEAFHFHVELDEQAVTHMRNTLVRKGQQREGR